MSIRYENIEIQFLYPFEISEWRKFRRLVLQALDCTPISKNPGQVEALISLKKSIPQGSAENKQFEKFEELINKKGVTNNNEFFELLEESLHSADGEAHELFKIRLKKLKEDYESSSDERFFNFLASIMRSAQTKAVFDDAEKKGTRPYLLKNLPHVVITPASTDLLITNIDAFPNIDGRLNRNKVGLPYIRLQSNIKLLASGFGLLKIRCCLFTEQGLDEAVDEVIFSSETQSCSADNGKLNHDKENLSLKIKKDITGAIQNRCEKKNLYLDNINKYIDEFCHKHCMTSFFIKQNINNLVDRANLLQRNISTSEVVDIQNLDRGLGWGKEPLYEWSSNGNKHGPSKLYKFFDHSVNSAIINPMKHISKQKLPLSNKDMQTSTLSDQLSSTISHIQRDDTWYAEEGIYPYVLTFVAAPKDFKKSGAKRLGEVEDHFSKQLENPNHKVKLARLLMKSPWKKMRIDLEPLKSYLQNVFYSDLLYMVVHIRSTLCFYYLPGNPGYEYEKYPELYNSIKYKRELEDTLASQRVLWYMYSTFNHKVSQEIKSISKTFESLTTHIKKEEFHQILDELTEITMGIDNRKIAIAEVMEDPLNRKGSTLFAEMVSKSSKAFRLRQLYLTLNDKLERLDMLGLHVNQTTNELSSLVLQETTRATQFTVEILEAFIIGVYVAEVVDLSSPSWLEHLSAKPLLFMVIAVATPLIALPIITLIRKSMSRFRGHAPTWQEWVERIGLGAGLIMLSILAFFVLRELHTFQKNPLLMVFVLVGLPIVFYILWLKIDSSLE